VLQAVAAAALRAPVRSSRAAARWWPSSGSVGYLRFSQPVVVRSLVARWSPEFGAPPAVVGGRLGLQDVWATHLDPKRLDGESWLDLTGGSLEPVDEILFAGTPGLEIGAMWVAAHEGEPAGESGERAALLLEPVPDPSISADGPGLRFAVKARRISPAAAPFVISLQEAIDRNLRLHTEPSSWAAPHLFGAAAHYPGLLTTESTPPERWTAAASANQEMLEHRLLPLLLGASPLAVAQRGRAAVSPASAEALVESLGHLTPTVPGDLRRALQREHQGLVEALHTWLDNGGGCGPEEPAPVPSDGEAEALQSYVAAKRCQKQLDLLTAAFLHVRQERVQQRRQP